MVYKIVHNKGFWGIQCSNTNPPPVCFSLTIVPISQPTCYTSHFSRLKIYDVTCYNKMANGIIQKVGSLVK